MGLRRDSWNRLLNDKEHSSSLVPIFMLAHEHDLDPRLRPSPIFNEQREDVLTRLAAGVSLTYQYFRPQQRAHAKA